MTFTVTNLNDSGIGSLRQAILDTNNATATDDTIVFQPGLSGLLLTSGGMTITDKLAINGPGASLLITGNNATRIFTVNSGVTAALSDLNLQNGGVSNSGTLTLSNSTIQSSTWVGLGAAIYNSSTGTLTVNNSELLNNSSLDPAAGSSYGGAIYSFVGILTVNNSVLSGNSARYGGGIANEGGTLIVNNSTLSGNSASQGGGIYDVSRSSTTVNSSTLSGNTASQSGGGIYYASGIMNLKNSTLSGNSTIGEGGGMTFFSATATVFNSTISGNSAATGGGGIFLNRGVISIGNSLVAGNIDPSSNGKEIYRYSGTFTSLGNNLFGENGSSGLVGANPINSDKILPGLINTAIGPLANNGGPTLTFLPVAGSLMIDAGNNLLIPQGVTTDQRGYGPRIVGSAVDIGAVEVGAVPPSSTGSAVGVFRNGQWFLDANGNGAWDGCGTEFCFSGFGSPGDMPASGNWDGGNKSYIGVLRSGTGEWFIDRNGNRQWDGCGTDGCYSGFGSPGDLPVAGDWSGNGVAKIGVFRNGQWFLDANGNGAWDGCGTELCLSFGQAGDLPAAGNWDGGLKAGAGVFRAGTWYLDYNGNGAWDGCQQEGGQDKCLFNSFGLAGDLPAAGDWNGDGKAKVGVFRNGTWYLDYNGNGAWDGCSVDRCYEGSFGQQGDLPVAGKW